ncbi:MAG: DUF1934 family protein [Erysipelotrichaceae bacterium]|nr:DUF1934 family protein [Erysipelotrichaceae bacterium]
MDIDYELRIRTTFLYPGQDGVEKQSRTVNGTVMREGGKLTIEYKDIGGLARIIYKGDEVMLKHGQSVLYLKKNQEVPNDYLTEFGTIKVNAKLNSVNAGMSQFHINYALSQDKPFVRVGIFIRWVSPDHEPVH